MTSLRPILLAIGLSLVASCDPEINPGAYICGPNRLCPPDLACDDITHTCEFKSQNRAFQCPDDSQLREPNDDAATASDLGTLSCGAQLIDEIGCLADDGDPDWYRMGANGACTGSDPHLLVFVTAPVSLAQPIVQAFRDQTSIGMPIDCATTPTGYNAYCMRIEPMDIDDIKVSLSLGDQSDCDGECRYNEYSIQISHRLQ